MQMGNRLQSPPTSCYPQGTSTTLPEVVPAALDRLRFEFVFGLKQNRPQREREREREREIPVAILGSSSGATILIKPLSAVIVTERRTPQRHRRATYSDLRDLIPDYPNAEFHSQSQQQAGPDDPEDNMIQENCHNEFCDKSTEVAPDCPPHCEGDRPSFVSFPMNRGLHPNIDVFVDFPEVGGEHHEHQLPARREKISWGNGPYDRCRGPRCRR